MWWRSATVLLMAVTLTACNGGGDPGTSGSPSAAAPSTTPPPTTDLPLSTTPSATSACPAAPAGATVVTATVAGGRVTTDHAVWSVKVGAQVRVAVTADVADEVHVHTYDAKGATDPGGCPTAIDFTASIPGSHEVELEKTHKLLFRIKVS